jgi:hypothetical protein
LRRTSGAGETCTTSFRRGRRTDYATSALRRCISLSRKKAERLTARAVNDGKNLNALVAEILEAAQPPIRKR